MSFLSAAGSDYDEELYEERTIYLDEDPTWASALPKLRTSCDHLEEFVRDNRSTVQSWLKKLA
jgi:hypothetical protein